MQSQTPRNGAKCTPSMKSAETLSPTQLATPPPGTPMAASALTSSGTTPGYFTGTPRTAHQRGGERSGAMSATSLNQSAIGGGSVNELAGGNSPVMGGRLAGGSDDHLPYSIIHSLNENTAAQNAALQQEGAHGGRHHGSHHYSSSGGTLYSSSGRMNLPSPKSGGPAFAVGVTPSPAETPTPMDEFDRMLKGGRQAVSAQGGTPAGGSSRRVSNANAVTTAAPVPHTQAPTVTPKPQPTAVHRPNAQRLVAKLLSDDNKKKQLLLDISQVVASLANSGGSSTSGAAATAAPVAGGAAANATPRVASAQGSQQPTPRVGPVTPSNTRVSPIQLSSLQEQPAAPPSAGIPARQRSGLGFSSPPPQADSDALFRIAQAAVKSTTSGAVASTITASGQHHMPGTAPVSTSPQGQWPPPSAAERGTIDSEMIHNAKRIHFDPSQQAPAKFSNAKVNSSSTFNQHNVAGSSTSGGGTSSAAATGFPRNHMPSGGGNAYSSGNAGGGAAAAGGGAVSITAISRMSERNESSNASSSGSSIVCKPKQSQKTLQLVQSTLAAHDSTSKRSRRRIIKSESSAFSEQTDGTWRSVRSSVSTAATHRTSTRK